MICARRLARDDDGSALVIGLILILFGSIFVAAILAFGEAGLNVAAGTAELRDEVYAGDGAVEAAIASTVAYLEAAAGESVDCPAVRFDLDGQDDLAEIEVRVACGDSAFGPGTFPGYEDWARFDDPVLGDCLDDPGDDPAGGELPLICDPGAALDPGLDVRILIDSFEGTFADVNDSGTYEPGEPLETPPALESVEVQVLAAFCSFAGYEAWSQHRDLSGDWLDDPSGDPSLGEGRWVFDDGFDIRILPPEAGPGYPYGDYPFADVDGSGLFDAGEPGQECNRQILEAVVHVDGPESGDPGVTIEHWRVIR